VRTIEDVPSSCSPDGCSHVLYVENPISKLIPIFPRTGFFATVRISGNTCFRQLDLAPFDRFIWPHPLVNPLSAPGRSEALRSPKGDAFRA
jgi:hypothetical protein